MKKKLLLLLFSLAALGLVSCGGGNDGASTGTPVVAQITIAQTVEACTASATYGGTGALLTATTAPTLAQCAAALPGIATGNPWTVYSNTGCAKAFGGNGPRLTQAQQNACNEAVGNNNNCGSGRSFATIKAQCSALGGDLEWIGVNSCFTCETPGP